jgi:hypothetical protein
MANCRFFTYHGWGFDSCFWDPWTDFLSNYGLVESYDRGYFNNSKEVKAHGQAESLIIITHSFGLHFVEEDLLNKADLLVITGGFLHFHPNAPKYRKRSRLILQQMIKEFEVKPEKVLHQFYQNCFAPQDEVIEGPEDFNHQLLLDDLRLLHQSNLEIEGLKKADKICILHGADDQIVPNQKGRQLHSQLGEKATYFEMKKAGHALPYVHSRQCLEFIEPRLEQI